MTQEESQYVRGILRIQKSTIELVAVAVVLALGINLLSSSLPQGLGLSNSATLMSGAALCLFSAAYIALRLGPALSRTIKLEGVLLLSEENEVHEISRYRFSSETRSHFIGLTTEAKALANTWRKAELGFCDPELDDAARRLTEAGNSLVRQAMEYFVLNELSLHLSAYFDSERRTADGTVVRVQRRDIPQILLDNRFLELFSKEMSEREAFQDHVEPNGGRIVFATGSEGQIFEHFELVLPRGSRLRRVGKALRIETTRFSLDIEPIYQGFATVLPHDFEELYLGVPFDRVDAHQVSLEIKVVFRWWSVMSPRSWDYYAWLDSFLEKLEKSFDFDTFLQSIGWEVAHSTAIAVRNSKNASLHVANNSVQGTLRNEAAHRP